MKLRSVRDAEVQGKRVLVRVDFNVPLDATRGKPQVVDDMRIRAALPTLELLHQQGASQIVLITHVDRPGGKVVDALRVAPIAAHLRGLTNVPFELRENLRFDPREELGDPSFAKELAALGDVFVNEAFADSHRAHASIVGVSQLLPSYAGLRFLDEVAHLSKALTPPQGALAIIGGAKFETKIPLLTKLITSYGQVLLGGALGNDLLKARGFPIGKSLVSREPAPDVLARDKRLIAAHDAVVREVGKNAERVCLINDIRESEGIIDIGPQTMHAWSTAVAHTPFVLWNGPLGVYEEGYIDGTDAIASALARAGVHAVVGGGDTVAALSKHTFDPSVVFVSTGGGAMLEFLTDGMLPGIEPLIARP